jgi:hypothetical protein
MLLMSRGCVCSDVKEMPRSGKSSRIVRHALRLALASALLAGYGMASNKARNWLHMLGLAFVMAVSVYVILDIEYPRLGFIRVDSFDQALVELRESMK